MEQAHLTIGMERGDLKVVLLVPAELLMNTSEPPTFMSVERPNTTKIIPTTWFDNGFSFYGTR